MSRRFGFTLIELLVVIAIIAILAAILFPVFARAKKKAESTTDLSNLKQMATAVHMYAGDYDEMFPCFHYFVNTPSGLRHADQLTMIHPYVKNEQMLACPWMKGKTSLRCGVENLVLSFNIGGSGYGYNNCLMGGYPSTNPGYSGWIDDDFHPKATALTNVDDSAGTILWSDNCCGRGGDMWPSNCAPFTLDYADKYMEGSNISFVDGHAKWRKGGTITKSDWTPYDD